MKTAVKSRICTAAVWLARIITGATFVISGWAKAIDPWGFIIKVEEYLTVWGLSFPREVVLTGCVTLACIEFCTGVMLATGSLKRFSAMTGLAMMAVMLPLTVYIYFADPVSDCGCFGDFIVISNGATLLKNIVLTALLVFLLIKGPLVRGLYPAPIQWLVITVTFAFPLWLSFVGYNVQPVVDFRPYKLGQPLFSEDSETQELYIYEKNGKRQTFTLDALPDSTWTFVDMEWTASAAERGFQILDKDGNDVGPELANADVPVLYLVIAEPDMQFLSRAHYVNRLNEYALAHGVEFVALVGATGSALDLWTELTRPRFPVYTVEDTALKQLVRGDGALVYVSGGFVRWKRTLQSMDISLSLTEDEGNIFETGVEAVDNGRLHSAALGIYIVSLIAIYMLSLSPRMLRLFVRRPKPDKGNAGESDTKFKKK